MSDPVVQVTDLRKVYVPSPGWLRLLLRTSVREPVVALDGISLTVEKGEICTILGPNGAGKSTLFRVLTGLTSPTSGRASILGFDVSTQSSSVRSRIGFSPAGEERTLLLRFTCRENLAFHGRLQGIPNKDLQERIAQSLELVGLEHAADRVGFALSSGMLARLMLARAILHEPPVLILDEPTAAIDPIGAYRLLNLIKEIAAERGMAVLLSSHRLDEVELLDTNVVLLDNGSIRYVGSLSEMRAQWDRPRVEVTFETASDATLVASILRERGKAQLVEMQGESIILESDMTVGRLLALANGQIERITSVREVRMGLTELLAKVLTTPGEDDA